MNVLLVVVCDLVVGAVAFLVSDPAPYDIILMDVQDVFVLIFFCKKSQRQKYQHRNPGNHQELCRNKRNQIYTIKKIKLSIARNTLSQYHTSNIVALEININHCITGPKIMRYYDWTKIEK